MLHMEKNVIKTRAALPVLLVVLVSALPALYLFCNNAYELRLADVLLPLGVSVALGLVALLLVWLITRDVAFSALLTGCGMALFLNFNFIVALVDRVAPGARVRVYYIVAAAVGVVLLFVLLRLRKKEGLCAIIMNLMCIAAVVVLAMNVITAVPDVIARRSEKKFVASAPAADKDAALPNIYYLIADEYASFTEIEKYYGYDNSAFADALTELGFCVSDTSYNRGGGTIQNMADTVNLAPVTTDAMTYAEYMELFNNGALYGVLEGMGYTLRQLGSLYPLPKLLEQETFALDSEAATMNGESATEILLNNSMLMPVQTIMYWRMVQDEGDLAVFNYLDDAENYEGTGGHATFLYICSPHPPFYYDADGNSVDAENWTNWEDTHYYLDQYIYITKRLLQTAKNIVANDRNAIILIQSDHGLRYHEDSDKPHTFWIDTEDQRRILNALYVGGKPVDITGLSGYNTWRVILSVLGEAYPTLPEE